MQSFIHVVGGHQTRSQYKITNQHYRTVLDIKLLVQLSALKQSPKKFFALKFSDAVFSMLMHVKMLAF